MDKEEGILREHYDYIAVALKSLPTINARAMQLMGKYPEMFRLFSDGSVVFRARGTR